MSAVEGLVAALERIAKTNGIICRTCGISAEECDVDPDPDACPGRIARAALAAFREGKPLREDEALFAVIERRGYRVEGMREKVSGVLDLIDEHVLGRRSQGGR